MTTQHFWEIVKQSKSSPDELKKLLRQLSTDEVVDWLVKFEEMGCELLHDAQPSRDAVTYEISGIISEGEEVFKGALLDRQNIGWGNYNENELYGYVAEDVLEERGIDPYDR